MKHATIVAVLLIVFFLMQCNKDSVSPANEELFPMEIGNIWHYESDPQYFGHSEMTIEIIGTKEIGGNTYFEFETRYPTTPPQRFSDFYRRDKDGKIYTNHNGTDALYIDFNRDIDDSWDAWGEYIGVIQSKKDTVEVPAGKFSDATLVFFDIPQAADDEFCEHYVRGVGRLDIHCLFGIPMQLVSAKISGNDISNQ